jgi:drug/metabolite transporter (DMT)-like permease
MGLMLTSKGVRARAAQLGHDLVKNPSMVSPFVAAGTTAGGSILLAGMTPGWRSIFGLGAMVGGVALAAKAESQFTRSVGAGLVGAGVFTVIKK